MPFHTSLHSKASPCPAVNSHPRDKHLPTRPFMNRDAFLNSLPIPITYTQTSINISTYTRLTSKRTNRKMAAMVIVKNFCLKLDPSKKNYPLENSTSILKISSITKISPSIGIESIAKRIIRKIAYIVSLSPQDRIGRNFEVAIRGEKKESHSWFARKTSISRDKCWRWTGIG